MKKSKFLGTLFACIVAVITISADAKEMIAYGTTDHYVVENIDHRQGEAEVTASTERAPSSRDRGVLDVIFLTSNALLGFLLLRRANHS